MIGVGYSEGLIDSCYQLLESLPSPWEATGLRRHAVENGAIFATTQPMHPVDRVFHSPSTPHAQNLRIVVVAPESLTPDVSDAHAKQEAERSRQLRIGLLENGYNLIAVLPADSFLEQRLAQLQPDMVIVDAESDARDALEHVVVATRNARRPIVMFTNDNDTRHVKDAVAAGVSAYIVAGLAPERIRPILDVAMARFEHEQGLRREIADAKGELQERKVIDRAKGVLMARQGLSEQAAYDKLRRTAMDKGLKLSDVAQRMLDVADLLA